MIGSALRGDLCDIRSRWCDQERRSCLFEAQRAQICQRCLANKATEVLFQGAKLSAVVGAGGFIQVRKATETPFNMILGARP
jgi:hypothetical protein